MQPTPNLPRTISVLGAIYTINLEPGLTSDGAPARGLCHTEDQLIQIDRDMHPQRRAETLVHETLHALEDALNLELGEEIVETLSRGLVAVLRDNPPLVRAVIG